MITLRALHVFCKAKYLYVRDVQELSSEPGSVPIKPAERRRIAEVALSDPSDLANPKGFGRHIDLCVDMIALCKRREHREPLMRQGIPKNRLQVGLPVTTTVEPVLSPIPEPKEKRARPLECDGFQCLYYLSSNLPFTNRRKAYRDKFALKRHTDRCRLKQFQSDDLIPCPDDLACDGVRLEGKTHFKRHAAEVHNFWL